MRACVLEKVGEISLREIDIPEVLGPNDVRVKIAAVGICGSDVHYYQHGAIGPFVVKEPMVLGHEAAGTVVEVGSAVRTLKAGDRVCMEPGIPDPHSRATRLGLYNLDPAVRFWATPPIHGCLRPTVVHPEAFTFALPDAVSFAEGALVEPLAVGLHAANKARISPGDVAVVLGAGPIGILTAVSALAGGCSRVITTDIQPEKLAVASALGPILPVNVGRESLAEVVRRKTGGWGADLVFDAAGYPAALASGLEVLRPGGCMVLIGMPGKPVAFDVVAAQVKEARIESIFRYAHVFPRAVALLASGQLKVASLITDRYGFEDSRAAFDYAVKPRASSVKVQIEMP